MNRLDTSPHLQWPARIALALSIINMLAILASSCRAGSTGELESLTLGLPALEQNALIYIADEQGFFSANGLDIVIKDYDSGVTALDGLLTGEVDLAEAAEFPAVNAILQKKPISIIVSNDKFENNYLVGRKDRGIEAVSDLKGKRIGVALDTISEFYLARFLDLKEIDLWEVSLVNLKPAQFVNAITSGEVDALIAWQPYVQRILEQGSDIVIWPAQNQQSVYGLLVCRGEWLAQHGDTVERFIRSLVQAETYLVTHPEDAKAIVQERLEYDSAYIASIWPQHQFSLSLDFSMVVAMSDEAHWMMNNWLTTEKVIPDFQNYIYTDGLEAVKPDAVNIIR
jgi:NitT/TauT family transport system substrate-binding protein